VVILLQFISTGQADVYGEGRPNILIGGIGQNGANSDVNPDYKKFADQINAAYAPTYYTGSRKADISEVIKAAQSKPTDQNGLISTILNNVYYDTIVAYSGGTVTAVTALKRQHVTCNTLILISPMNADVSPISIAGLFSDIFYYINKYIYKYQIKNLLDNNYVKQIIVIQSKDDVLILGDLYQARFKDGEDTRIDVYDIDLETTGERAHIDIFFTHAMDNLVTDSNGKIIYLASQPLFYQESNFEPVKVEVNTVSISAPKEEWNRTFGGASSDEAYSVQPTPDGGYIIAGSFGVEGEELWLNHADAWLIKTDSLGNDIWKKTFGGQKDDSANSVQPTPDGGYILAGVTESFGAGGKDAWLIKTDSLGNDLWKKTFGGWNDDSARSIQITADGGYILAGETMSFSDQGKEALQYLQQTGVSEITPWRVFPRDRRYNIDNYAWLVKTDAYGNELWNQTYGKTMESGCYGYDDYSAHSVHPTFDGGYILDSGNRLIKTDANGNELWNRTLVEVWIAEGHSVKPTLDDGYIISITSCENHLEGWLIKTDIKGNKLWHKNFSSRFLKFDVHPTVDGGYILAGSNRLIKIDTNGNELWNCKYGDCMCEVYGSVYSVNPTSDGGYILAGTTIINPDKSWDAWLIKIGPS